MAPLPRAFRRHARISDLCTVFEATLYPLHEEGLSLHFPHERPVQVVVGPRGDVLPRTDRHLAVILGMHRTTDLLPHMEEDLRSLALAPGESLFLSVPIGDPVISTRGRLVEEASRIFMEVAEAEQTVIVTAISHRRVIHENLVIRHNPVALFDAAGTLLWAHPAGHGYGLIREGFPRQQKIRLLGSQRLGAKGEGPRRRLNEVTGLPEWYQIAKEEIQALQEGEPPSFELVIGHQAHLWLQHALMHDEDQALREATQDFLTGFEQFFGAGGLNPMPMRLAFP